MFGAFIVTENKEILLAQFGDHKPISKITFSKEYALAAAILEDGSEENFTEPLLPETAEALGNATKVLVGDFGDNTKVIRQYEVPVILTGMQ